MNKLIFILSFLSALSVLADSAPTAYYANASRQVFYTVPVPPEDAAVASFNLPGIYLAQEDGKAHLKYHLPAELVGPNQPGIDLLQTGTTDGWIELAGDLGTARCQSLQTDSGLCLISYKNLNIQPQDVEGYLRQTYPADPTLDKRLAVSKIFANEPAGILRYGVN